MPLSNELRNENISPLYVASLVQNNARDSLTILAFLLLKLLHRNLGGLSWATDEAGDISQSAYESFIGGIDLWAVENDDIV